MTIEELNSNEELLKRQPQTTRVQTTSKFDFGGVDLDDEGNDDFDLQSDK